MTDYACRVTAHGQRQLELDITYPVDTGRRVCKYNLDLFIFTSSTLGLSEERYGIKSFLDDLKSYTRHKTPRIPFASLVDPACEVSPLTRIKGHLAGADLRKDLRLDHLLYEIRTLANIHNAETRNVRHLLRDELAKSGGSAGATARLKTYLAELDAFLATSRELHQAFLDSRVPDTIREAMRWADEAISLKTEKNIYRLHEMFREAGADEAVALLGRRLGREDAYRAEAGYDTHVSPDDQSANEQFIYRESVLKKWAQGAMYMSVERSKALARVAQILAASAAAVAMAFALGATFLTQQYFSSDTVTWAALIVVAYIFKDRIKETLRSLLLASLPRFVADRAHKLVDTAAGRTVGSTRERVRFLAPADVPKDVCYLRDIEGNPFRSILPVENVIHYHKTVRINSRALMKYHTRLDSITEILRLKLDSWLSEMDEPVQRLSCARDGERRDLEAPRVYHANLVLQMSDGGSRKAPALLKHRIIMNRDGIVRTEKLERLSK